MTRPRVFRWGMPETPTPQHPYRDTFLVYGAIAILIVLFGWLTGGNVVRAALVALAVFVAASAWSAASWRRRLRREAAERREL
ncbi:MAG TPA: hypothetical protein VMH61_00170 [Candidatus Acidoferrales bacterium]|nr:hypothetical protein [Candidatus Acidoferrales bacterium]